MEGGVGWRVRGGEHSTTSTNCHMCQPPLEGVEGSGAVLPARGEGGGGVWRAG